MSILKLFEGTGDLNCVVVTIVTPEGSTQKVVDGASFSIGRAPDCVLSIPHAGVSRLHVLVTVKRGEVYIMDQESSNGTFLNGEKIEPKRLVHIKPEDEIKLGLSEVRMKFNCLEKHFKTDYIAESLLPNHEKDNLQALIRASNHKAQEIVAAAQAQADHITQVSNEKARNLENQTLLKQEEIISAAQVEGQHLVADSKRKAAQLLLENEEKAKSDTQHIHDQAERIRKEAEVYFQNRVKEAEQRGTEIIEQHTKLGQELIEDLKEKTVQKTQEEVKQQMANVVSEIEDKSKYLKELQTMCTDYETKRKKEIDEEVSKIKSDLMAQFDKEKEEKILELQGKVKNLEIEYSEKTQNLESMYQTLTTELEEKHKKRIEESEASLVLQKKQLEEEVATQRQQLAQLNSDLNKVSSDHNEFKQKTEDLKNLLQGLQSSESDLIKSLNEKREQIKKSEDNLAELKSNIDQQQEKLFANKQNLEAQIEDLNLRLPKLKAAFEAESDRLKKESELEVEKYKEEQKKLREQTDQIVKQEKAEIHKKTSDYMDSERAKLDAYRADLLAQKKELDHNFEKTRKEFENKTREAIELEKSKLEDTRQSFMTNLNRQRQVITDDITIGLMKSKNHGEDLTATGIAEVVGRVFSSHVTTLSVDSQTSKTQDVSRLKFQWMGYGLATAVVAMISFNIFIKPQINRHIAGTDEHAAASVPVERPKYTPPQTLEYRDSYADAVLYTKGFADIYLDEQIHDKWFKPTAAYMYEKWRIDEDTSFKVMAIGKTLVQTLRESANNLDAEFYQKGIEKMRELEAENEKRMIELLGNKVKYGAYKRKEREFLEPYIQNQ